MMKLQLDQVLEYVRGGEVDPFVKEMLERDPDGADMLRQARLMFDVLGEGPAPDDDAMGAGAVADAAPDLYALSAERAGDLATDEYAPDLFDDQVSRVSEKQIAGLSKLAQRASGPIRRLGELRIVHWPDRVDLSYEPGATKAAPGPRGRGLPAKGLKTFYQSAADSLGKDSKGAAGVVIPGLGLELALAESVDPEDPLKIRITNTRLRIPARALEIIFMPESGPFERTVTDSRGVAELPVPSVSGTLRIETEKPLILAIHVKK
jgi:hypothetical protein